MSNDGHYTTVSPHAISWQYDLNVPVEGMREGWQERMIANGRHLPREKREGYIYALRMLASAEVMPPAYERSVPIMRFQYQLRHVLEGVEL